jgi:hypothetical protein
MKLIQLLLAVLPPRLLKAAADAIEAAEVKTSQTSCIVKKEDGGGRTQKVGAADAESIL